MKFITNDIKPTSRYNTVFYTCLHEFFHIAVEQALHRPTWKVNRRITMNFATLMNTGFAFIEACRLFDVPPDHVGVLIHP